jgi:hypothetical protein
MTASAEKSRREILVFGLCIGGEELHFAAMSAEDSTHFILLAGVFGVLVVILVVLGSISRTLMRMERRMGQQEVAKPVANPASAAGMSMKKIAHRADFISFLGEDPQRRSLPKREQFAAYRNWRKEKGLSWPQSPENQTET